MSIDDSFLHLYSYEDTIRIARRAADIPSPVPTPGGGTDDEVSALSESVSTAYETIVHWRKNLFEVPSSAVGRRFVKELTTWLKHFSAETKFRPIAIKTFLILPALLLQKPSANSKRAEHKKLLEARLDLWERRDISELLRSGNTIQKRLVTSRKTKKEDVARRFSNLMFEGKVTAAVRMLCQAENKGVLPFSDETMTLLKKKHPCPTGIRSDTLLNGRQSAKQAKNISVPLTQG